MQRGHGVLSCALLAFSACYHGRGDDDAADGSIGETSVTGDEGEAESGEPPPLDCEGSDPGPRRLRLLTRTEYANTLEDLLGIAEPDLSTVPVEPTVAGFDNNANASVVTRRHVDAYMALAEGVASQAMELDAPTLIGCMPEDPACARSFIATFGRRAYRRPLADAEIDHLLAQFDDALTDGDFYEGVRLAIRAMLMSPHFLYRSELGEAAGGGFYRLTPHEIAASLAYTYWATMPDEELLAAAESGQLDDAEGREAQARRLLDDPRGHAQLGRFAMQWLGTGVLLQANKDPMLFPSFDDNVRKAMIDEETRFVDHVVYESTGTFRELLTADYVFVNDALARYYGLPQPGSDQLVKTQLDPGASRGGLLRLGAIVAGHAHAMESAPVLRGVFVRKRLMCHTLSPPPPDLDTTPPGLDPSLSTRERYARHASDPSCASCHRFIDPIGFSFEAYDGAGGYREQENGFAIDASGSVHGIEQINGADETPYDGPGELGALLADSPNARACLVRQYFRFVNGREEATGDKCVLDELAERFETSGQDLYEMFIAQTRLESFTLRRG